MGKEKPRSNSRGKFLNGSIMRHIVVMTASAGTGLFAIFAADFINIFYLGRLGQVEVSAAAGYAATFFFFLISIGIGLSIATVALVAPALGSGDLQRARRLTFNAHVFTFGLSALVCFAAWPFIGRLLDLLGAAGTTHALAESFLRIAVPSAPFLTTGMTSGAVLRSAGDARWSMWVTLSGALVTMALDPIFIFVLNGGIEGAAVASSLARFVIMLVGLYGVMRVHGLLSLDMKGNFLQDGRALAQVAIPAVATNLATPFANAYVTKAIAVFGDGAVAGSTILGRLLPVVFVGIFAMTGAVGPIVGQNLGARSFDRVRGTVYDAIKLTAVYTSAVWAVLALSHGQVEALMKANGQAAELIAFYCIWLTPLFGFMGVLFVSNAVFNNLGRAAFATALNWLRATLGTIPLVILGADMGAARGVLAGQALGGVFFGVAALFLCLRTIRAVEGAALPVPAEGIPEPSLTS